MSIAKISVIIPVRNGEHTIKDTIASLLQQTYSDWELIVINDGSSDQTLAILQEIVKEGQFSSSEVRETPTAPPQIRIFSQLQAGVSASRNRGAAQAQGEFLAFLDADDLWARDKLELQLQALENTPQACLAYSWTNYIDVANKFLYPGSHVSYQGEVYEYLLINNFLENGSNALIRRDKFQQAGGFDESLTGGEEWDLFIRMAREHEFVAVSQVQVLYRLSDRASSVSIDRQAAECLKVIDRAFQASPDHLQYLKPRSLSHLYRYLTFRGLSSDLAYTHPWLLLRYFIKSLYYDPQTLTKRGKLAIVVIIKLTLAILLPESLARKIISYLQKKS